MKALRILFKILVVFAALIALVIVLALTPAIQTWAVHKALAGQPGMKLDTSRVSAGLSAADLSDVHFVKDGLVVSARHVAVRYSAWDYLRRHQITVDDLMVDDLVVDLRAVETAPQSATATSATAPAKVTTTPTAASEPTARQPFNGLLNQVQLPFDVRIARFSVPGRVLLPGDKSATFEVNGSDITTGHKGTVDWKADLTSAAANAPLRALHTSGTVVVHLTPERRIDVLELNAVASAEGPTVPADQLKVELKAEQPASGGNEGYNAGVSLVRGTTAEPLATLVAQYDAARHELAGGWTLTVRPDGLSALLGGLGLPDIAADSTGKFTFNPDAANAAANGELHCTLSHPEKISPDLAAVGRLDIHVSCNGGMKDNIAQLEQLAIDVTAANGQQLAQIRTLQRVGYSLTTQRVTFSDTKADLARIKVDRLPLAWAQPFAKSLVIDSGEASLALAIAAEPDGSHVRVSPAAPLTLRNVTVRSNNQKLADRMTLSVKPSVDYSPDRLTAALDELSVTSAPGDSVTGRFTVDVAHPTKSPSIAFTTDTQAKFVAMLKPYLNADTGPMMVETKSQGSLVGQRLQFTSSSTRILRDTHQLVAAIDLQQPLTVDLQTNAIVTPKPTAESLRVVLGEIPLAWAQGFVPNATFGGQITGGTIGITVKSIDDISANATQPIVLRAVTVAMNHQPLIKDVDVSADFTAAKKGPAVTYDLRRIEARQGATSLLSLAVAGDVTLAAKPTIAVKGTLAADLGALAQQPVLVSSASLSRGELDGTFEAKVADTIQAKAKLTARNLMAKANNQPLGEAVLELTAAVQSDGTSVLKIPFTLANGARKSDLLIDGKLGRAGNAFTFNGSITSNLLVIDDLKPLAALAPSSSPAPGSPATPPAVPVVASTAATPRNSVPMPAQPSNVPPAISGPARDAQAFWSVFGGKIDLDLKRITYGSDYVISGVRGSSAVTPTQLALNSLEGQFKDQPFKVTATIAFDRQQPQPYTLAGTADVQNFDVGAFLQAANPNQKPQLETKVTVNAKLNGKGGTAGDLAQNVYGTFDVTGSKGVLRALGNKAGTTVNRGSSLLGLAGALTGSDTTAAVAELTQKLAELPFDKVTVHAERGADLNLKVGRIEFLSPDTRVLGAGEIKHQPGVPIQNQPMQFTLQLSGKEGMAYLLNRLKVLNGQQDELGYYPMEKKFTIGGTPTNPDSSDLTKYLASLGVRMGAEGLLKYLGK